LSASSPLPLADRSELVAAIVGKVVSHHSRVRSNLAVGGRKS
jgi:hypothetical protein